MCRFNSYSPLPPYEILCNYFDRCYVFSHSLRLENRFLHARTKFLPWLAMSNERNQIV